MASVPEEEYSPSPSYPEVISFGEYLQRVQRQPDIAETAHHRLWRMIAAEGSTDSTGRPFPFFSRELLGIDDTIKSLVEDYFRPAALGLEVRKRILLLVGPVSGGKSTMVSLIKRGLETFTQKPGGALYALEGCPMQEEPLHLVPNDQRAVVGQQLGVVIEGDLCPWCRWQLQETFHGAPEQMRVRRVYLSEAGRCGIGTYAPSDPKSQDIADLIGTIDFQAISQYGTESDPRAYRFDGELNIANRGVMEFQEMLKLDEKFLYHLLSLSQEGNFKTGRYPLVSADEVIIGHCNEHEYQAFIQNPRNRALRSRLLVIPVPYNLDVAAEIRIYQKLLALTPTATHIAPSALEMAATVAVLSRLKEEPRPGGDRVSKLQMRSSSRVVGDGGPIEGFDGLDPRYVINRLSALVCQPVPCVDGLAVLDALVGGISRDPFVEPALREHLQEWAGEAKGIFDRRLEGDVIRAFALHWHRHLEDLYHNYLDHVVLSVRQTWEGEDRPRRGRQPDEVLLRAIEERMGVSENQKTTFREEIFFRWQRAAENGDELSYADHCGLRDALEQKLFDDLRDEVKVTTLSVNPDAETVVAIDKAVQAMMASGEYCPHCAQSAIRYVGELLNR